MKARRVKEKELMIPIHHFMTLKYFPTLFMIFQFNAYKCQNKMFGVG